jgi:3-hydroxyacyl-CoA dehydrogenase
MREAFARYNKIGGGAVGAGIAALVFVVVGVDVSDQVEKVLSAATILAGVLLAPKNAE